MNSNQKIRDMCVNALAIMDESGRGNTEGNSTMLWDGQWHEVRSCIFDVLETVNAEEQADRSLEERHAR